MNRYKVSYVAVDADGEECVLKLLVGADSLHAAAARGREELEALGFAKVVPGAAIPLGPAPPPTGIFYERKISPNTIVTVQTVEHEEGQEGGAHWEYRFDARGTSMDSHTRFIQFQHGNPDHRINGVTNEQLLAVVRHRLQGFQSGPCACEENAEAGKHIDAALAALERRLDRRIASGVAGGEG